MNYVIVYDPSADPFGAAQGAARLSHLNPLDERLLGWLRSGSAHISKLILGSESKISCRATSRLQRILTKVHNFYPRSLVDTLGGPSPRMIQKTLDSYLILNP